MTIFCFMFNFEPPYAKYQISQVVFESFTILPSEDFTSFIGEGCVDIVAMNAMKEKM